MTDEQKTKAQLIDELQELRHRVASLEKGTALEHGILHGEGTMIGISERTPAEHGELYGEAAMIGISEGRPAEDALLESEARFRETAELLPSIIAEMDLEGRIIYINKLGLDIFGISADTQLNSFDQFLHPDDYQRALQNAAAVLRGDDVPANEYRMLAKDGQLLHMVVRSAPIFRDGEIVGLRSSVQDVTDRVAAEADRRAGEERFRTIFHGITEGILVTRTDTGRIVMVNQAMCEMLRATEEEVLAMSLEEIRPCRDALPMTSIVVEPLRTKRRVASEQPIERRNGSVFYADVSAIPVTIDGQTCLLECFRDVTERRELQANIYQSDRMASLGLLAAGVAHEINNPLTYVLFNLDALREDVPLLAEMVIRLQRALGPERTRHALGEMAALAVPSRLDDIVQQSQDAAEGARRVRDIVGDLKTFARVDENRLVVTCLNDIIDSAISLASNEIKYRARLVTDFDALPTMAVNDGKLAQVFLNLLLNATHAIEEGNAQSNEIRVRTWAEGDQVVAQLQDTGKGISPEHLPHVFEPFFTTKEVGVGSGLGLSICRKIITELDGEITVDSEQGKGTRFMIRLPIGTMVPERTAVEEASVAQPLCRKRILVIDDERHIAQAVERLLEDEHEAVSVTSAKEAMEIFESDWAFDGIICDLMMPNVTGMDLHEWLVKHHPDLADRMIFVTGGAFTPRARTFLERVDNPRLNASQLSEFPGLFVDLEA